MKTIVKTLMVCAICLQSSILSAQSNEYLDSENSRIAKAQQIETEIDNFIADNFDQYELSEEISEEIIEHLRNEEEFTDGELQKAIVNAKIVELRKLFFSQKTVILPGQFRPLSNKPVLMAILKTAQQDIPFGPIHIRSPLQAKHFSCRVPHHRSALRPML